MSKEKQILKDLQQIRALVQKTQKRYGEVVDLSFTAVYNKKDSKIVFAGCGLSNFNNAEFLKTRVEIMLFLTREVHRYNLYLESYRQGFNVICEMGNILNEARWPEMGEKFLVVGHVIDELNGFLLFELIDKQGVPFVNNSERFGTRFPSTAFSPDVATLMKQN